jgi:hypothetical protein
MDTERTTDRTHLTVWTYPWDVARLGVDAVLADLSDHGIDGIDLAATYHPISAVSPREVIHGFFCPRGAVFFPARRDRYELVQPDVWPDADVVRAWHDVAARVDSYGLELNGWTIALFQPWIAQQYPETARVYATGARLDAGVCISSPHVRAYLRALVADMTDQFPIGLVKLEGIYPPAFDYGWTRRRIYFDLSPVQERLMALCFCASCTAAGVQNGLDVGAIRERVVAGLRFGAPPEPDPFATDPELAAYAMLAPAAAAALVRELAEVLRRGGSAARLAVASPFEGGGAGLPVESVLGSVATVILANLRADPAALRRAAAVVRTHDPRPSLECFVHPPFTPTATGGIPHGIREDLDDPTWRSDLRTALELGVDRFSLYNYGLLTAATFDRLVAAARHP